MATQIATGSDMPDGVATVSHRLRHEPDYVVCGDATRRFYAAKWQLPAHRVRTDCRTDNILVWRRRGASPIAKTSGGKSQHGYAVPGSFTFIPSGEYAHYAIESASVYLEVFVAPALLQDFAAEHDLGAAEPGIRPVLAQTDPWLAGYFQMLETEIELYRTPHRSFDVLLLGQAQQLLAAHLLRSYSAFRRDKLQNIDRVAQARALRPHLLKRVYEYIDAHLAADIRLSDLARLAHVSERHFIRAFHAATGCTPYRFVVKQRLHACADLLRARPDLSIGEIAASMGFRSRPHFSAKFAECFGVTPAAYRTRVNL